MDTKKVLLILIITVCSIGLVSTSAFAGSKQRHRWEGVAIGVGAAILAHTIFQAAKPRPRPYVVNVGPESENRLHHGHRNRRGHWEWQKTWVPPTTERVWNPGHYNRRGRWVKGNWIEVVTQAGYWSRQRIWIAGNQCRR